MKIGELDLYKDVYLFSQEKCINKHTRLLEKEKIKNCFVSKVIDDKYDEIINYQLRRWFLRRNCYKVQCST